MGLGGVQWRGRVWNRVCCRWVSCVGIEFQGKCRFLLVLLCSESVASRKQCDVQFPIATTLPQTEKAAKC